MLMMAIGNAVAAAAKQTRDRRIFRDDGDMLIGTGRILSVLSPDQRAGDSAMLCICHKYFEKQRL